MLATDEPFGAIDLVWVAVLRVCSNPRVFPVPSPVATLFDFRSNIEVDSTHIAVSPGSRHREIVERLCRQHHISGNLVNDAYIASAAIEHGADLVSVDGDFGRFRELRWIDPRVA